MAIANAVKESWMRPSPFINDLNDFFNPSVNGVGGVQDTCEAIGNCFDWMAHLKINQEFANRASGTASIASDSLAIPAFLGNLGALKNSVLKYTNSDDSAAATQVVDHTLLVGVHGAKSSFALDALGIVSLKDVMKGIKTAFWCCLIALDSRGLYNEIGEAKLLQKNLDATHDPKLTRIYEHKIQNSYLKILQHAVIAVAIAPLCLISILFASIAHGVLFHPVVMLSLTSIWCALNFATYFYGKAIDRWEKESEAIKV